jgi:signal transduction histidine kinase
MKGIRARLVGSYLIIILIAVIILDFVIISTLRQYFYSNAEDMLYNQIKVSADYYNSYLSSSDLKDNIQDNADTFWKNTTAEVQVIDLSGNILMDSIGALGDGKISSSDYKKAVLGERGRWIGEVNYDTERVLSVAYPLRSGNEIVGVLRFVTSLSEVNKTLYSISFILISTALAVVIISGLVSIILSNTILEPLKEITQAAEYMASGKFNKKIIKRYNDEIGQLSDTLNFMADEILNNERLKNDFISSISHELRTPLTSIKGWAITLNTGSLDDKESITMGLGIIEKESDRLSSLVEDLLDFSKLASGKTVLNLKEASIIEIAEYIKAQLTPRAIRQNIDFTLEYTDNIPNILIDQNRIKQVFINLIDNAFNFTFSGGKVVISIQSNDTSIIISVKDTGCGIPANELPKVTEKFFKGKNANSKNGIGLSICDEIIKLHNGELKIYSEENKGTEVYFYLPL